MENASLIQGANMKQTAFLISLSKTPVLSAEDEKAIIIAWKADRNPRHIDKLIRGHSRLILREIHRFRKTNADPMDLFQEACLGLIKSLNNYDPNRGFRFVSYSIWWWKVYIQNFLLKTKSIVWHADRQVPQNDVGITPSSHDYEPGTLQLDFFESDIKNPEELSTINEGFRSVQEALGTLPLRNQQLIGDRLLHGKTLEEVGKDLGVTRERARQIEMESLNRVREQMGILETV